MTTVLKTMTYGMTHFAVATGVAYVLTGDLAVAASIGLIEPVVQTAVYSLHELAWDRQKPRAIAYDASLTSV